MHDLAYIHTTFSMVQGSLVCSTVLYSKNYIFKYRKNRNKVSVFFKFFYLSLVWISVFCHSHNMFSLSLYLGFDEVPCPVSWIDSEVPKLSH